MLKESPQDVGRRKLVGGYVLKKGSRREGESNLYPRVMPLGESIHFVDCVLLSEVI